MWVRQAFFRWLIPAAFVLPLWLFIGWIVFGANPWALLWVLVSAPIVFVGQIVLTLLVRARGTVRTDRAVSGTDAAVLGSWHALIVALGVFDGSWWWPILGVTVAVGVAALWTSLWQLWREARPSAIFARMDESDAVRGNLGNRARDASASVIVVEESRTPRKP
jgi:hypothetical protein